jgi:geranylgeranyl reductase family protein
MLTYDVVIVGAGPAGSTAAYFLAQAGARVCLVDRQPFPRDKICGDVLLSPGLARLARMNLADWLQQYNAPGAIRLSSPNGQAATLLLDRADYGRIIPRLELDEMMLRQATRAGAEFIAGATLTGMTRLASDRLRLTGVGGLCLESKMLITADGAHAAFSRSLGLVQKSPDYVAVRAYFAHVAGGDKLFELHFDPAVMPGYAWIFPLHEGRANVGLGTLVQRSRRREVNLKQLFQRFIATNPYAQERLVGATMVGPLKGHPLRTQMSGVTPVADNILVAGEAAGLVNPLNGEGIGTAIISGELAGQYAAAALHRGDFSAGGLAGYAHALHRQVGRQHRVGALLRRILEQPPVMNRVVRRAGHDPEFGLLIAKVIIEALPPTAAFSPSFLLRLLIG